MTIKKVSIKAKNLLGARSQKKKHLTYAGFVGSVLIVSVFVDTMYIRFGIHIEVFYIHNMYITYPLVVV